MKSAIKAALLILALATLASAQNSPKGKYTLTPEFQKASLRMLEVLYRPGTSRVVYDNAVIDLGAAASTPNEECLVKKLSVPFSLLGALTVSDTQGYVKLKALLQSGSVKCADESK